MNALGLAGAGRTPLVLQHEVAECGLACLAMVAAHHGLVVDLRGLRQRLGLGARGATVAMLADAATKLGLRSRALRLEPSEIAELRLPAILHWDMRHFVVVERAGRDGVEVLDPARGARRVSPAELSQRFTGVALELEPAPEFQPAQAAERFEVRDLFTGVAGLRGVLARLLLVSFAVQALALAAPLATQLVVDEVLVTRDTDLLRTLVLGFGILLAGQMALSAARSLAITAFAAQLARHLHSRLFEHLVALPLEYFRVRHGGDIAARFGSLDAVQRTLTTSFVEGVIDGLLGASAAVMLWLYSPLLASLATVALVAYLVVRWAWYAPLRQATEEQIHHGAIRQSHLWETLRAVPTLRVFGGEAARTAHQDMLNCNSLNAGLRASRLGIAASVVNGALFGIENLLSLWLGAKAVIAGELSVGMLMAFASFKATFTGRLAGLVDRWIEYRMLALHAERIGGIALEPRLPRHERSACDGGPRGARPCAAAVALRGLGFRHGQGPWLFRRLELEVAAGRCLAVVGPSGCGKSTLAQLILGLLEATEGQVLVDGLPVKRGVSGEPWYGITAVLQDDALLAGSIAENIAFHRGGADPARVEHAARLAGIHDEIAAMPMGYDSLLGEAGGSLSGGQRQRVLLARALYFEPRLLVLDEATSHLDPARERSVVERLRVLPMTRIVIAHRPESIRLADQVLDLGALQSDMRAWSPQV